MEFITPNETNADRWRRLAVIGVRIAGGVAAVSCLFAGMWTVWGELGRGLGLIGLGVVLGVVFGRYPSGAAASLERKGKAVS